jgi:hypothetical protein
MRSRCARSPVSSSSDSSARSPRASVNSPRWRQSCRPVAASIATVSRPTSREYELPSVSLWLTVARPAGISSTPAATVLIQLESSTAAVDQRTAPVRTSCAVNRRLPGRVSR